MNKPHCLGFIMDGNRRWAKEQALPTLEGHRKGMEVFIEAVKWLREEKIPNGIFYAFSTENWNRSDKEISYLIDLFAELLSVLSKKVDEEKVRLKIVGDKSSFSEDLQRQMSDLEERSAKYIDTTIWVALSYGGRAELLKAINKAVKIGEVVTEESFEKLLWTAGMPDPDMIIRTSGEQRLSNFLPWQSVYSEFYFIEKHWPTLTADDFKDILAQYEKRERRKGI